MGQTKYFRGLDELHNTPQFQEAANNEFPKELTVDEFLGKANLNEASTSRRDFLKFLGFSVTAATVAACETPVIKSIPYVNKPEEITPGVANYYASTYYDGQDFANIMVKTREGRPIYIKGNKNFGITAGATGPRVNASVLGLYDSARLQSPIKAGKAATWKEVDAEIAAKLEQAKGKGKIRILTSTVISPSLQTAINGLVAKFNTGEGTSAHITADAYSYSAIRKANEKTFGVGLIPTYNFGAAKTIVGIGADFMGSWLMYNEYVSAYAKNRKADSDMSRHFQYESLMTVTGASADVRIATKPSEEGQVALAIYNHLAAKAGVSAAGVVSNDILTKTKKAAEELWATKGSSLVVAGSNNLHVQLVVNHINQLLGNYGTTIDLSKPVNLFNGNDEAAYKLVEEMKAGEVSALIVYGLNPAYHFFNAADFKAGLAKVGLKISLADFKDETASLCDYVCPDNHFLESWNDFMPKAGEYALAQPTISRLFNTRQAGQSFLVWSGDSRNYLDLIKETAQANVFPKVGGMAFGDFWNNSLHNGAVSFADAQASPAFVGSEADLNLASTVIEKSAKNVSGTFEVLLYNSTAIGVGNQANNPWLQELPDPITKITWDNYLTVSPVDAQALGFNTYIGEDNPASVAEISINGKTMKLPVYVLPGQKAGTMAVALGYGRGENGEEIGKAAFQTGTYGGYLTDDNGKKQAIGVNVFPLAKLTEGCVAYSVEGVQVKNTGETFALACTQTQHTVMGRDSIVRETTLGTYRKGNREDFNPVHAIAYHEGGESIKKPVDEIDLWGEHPVENIGHRWGMAIDLNSCHGCGACIIACHAENNVPVVGKDEIRRSRDMHWLRLDRYFSSAEEPKKLNGEDFSYDLMEIPEENPKVVFMPMMCQHCNHAPCETVCPVAATTHSNEGINQMTYNRCIGTRYCANNCPYKVRRFNWFNYQEYRKFTEVNPAQDDLGRMVLNPDVTVRARGVMEKCSLCVGRIQAGKLEAKKKGEPIQDGAIQTACAEACPTHAITFGDINDKGSVVAGLTKSNRAYRVIEEVGTQTNMYYMVKVRNNSEKEA
ncbi:MAG TPA: TAT-variant-translocated molybdopterin oxidoreductase [Luteibaculaceae bacterium]|nr:TAT-variant-translocated molybdopterin oxidoreductase [Luteibaculaceae bacterium]